MLLALEISGMWCEAHTKTTLYKKEFLQFKKRKLYKKKIIVILVIQNLYDFISSMKIYIFKKVFFFTFFTKVSWQLVVI